MLLISVKKTYKKLMTMTKGTKRFKESSWTTSDRLERVASSKSDDTLEGAWL